MCSKKSSLTPQWHPIESTCRAPVVASWYHRSKTATGSPYGRQSTFSRLHGGCTAEIRWWWRCYCGHLRCHRGHCGAAAIPLRIGPTRTSCWSKCLTLQTIHHRISVQLWIMCSRKQYNKANIHIGLLNYSRGIISSLVDVNSPPRGQTSEWEEVCDKKEAIQDGWC